MALTNFKTLMKDAMPHFLRKVNLLAWVNVVANEMNFVNSQLDAFQTTINDTVKFTGQKVYLEEYLNGLYDPISKGIYIENQEKRGFFFTRNDIEGQSPLWFWNDADGPAPVPPPPDPHVTVYLNNNSELLGTFEFIVFIPSSITFDINVIRDQINFYKPSGRRYDVQTY